MTGKPSASMPRFSARGVSGFRSTKALTVPGGHNGTVFLPERVRALMRYMGEWFAP